MNAKLAWILHSAAAIGLACSLVVVGVKVADQFPLPVINGWALMHGGIFVVFPAYILLFFLVLRPIAMRLQPQNALVGSTRQQSISLLAIFSVLSSSTGFLIPMVGSIVGIATGHIARRRCRIHPEIYGSGIAWAGLFLGYVSLLYFAYVLGLDVWVASRSGS